jgi:glycosyltransferase involved in cell wall biosynthesis
MKVLYWSPYVGHVGTIKAVVNSARAFSKYGGHDVTLIKNHSEWAGNEDILSDSGVRIVDFGLKRYFPNLYSTTPVGSRLYMLTVALIGFFQLFAYIRKHRPELIVANLVVVPAVLCTRLFRKPPRLVISIQGFPKFLGNHGPEYPLWMRVEDTIRKYLWNRIYNDAELLVCMTPSTKDKLAKNTSLSPTKLVVINNPIVDDFIHNQSQQTLHDTWLFDEVSSVVVAIGRLTPQKDFHTLIRAAKLVRRHLPIKVAVLGEGELRDELQAEIDSRGLQDFIRLYGFVSNPYAYLSRAKLFVLTSRWEDPGHAILEAAALRVPIVSTDCPSGPAALLSNGLAGELCPVGDHESLAAKMVATLHQKSTNKVQLAFENAQQFSLEAHYAAFQPYLDRWGAQHAR